MAPLTLASDGTYLWMATATDVQSSLLTSPLIGPVTFFVAHQDLSVIPYARAGYAPGAPIPVPSAPTSLVASDTALYWMDATGRVYRALIANGSVQPLLQTGTLTNTHALALDPTGLYVLQNSSNSIVRLPL